MIVRQGLNFAAHLLAGAIVGALLVIAAGARRTPRVEPLEPRQPRTKDSDVAEPAAAR